MIWSREVNDLKHRGIITVVSGPSGCGKNSIINEARSLNKNLSYVTSATTREMRNGEAEGVNYYYKTNEEFTALVESGEILEWDYFCGNRYGTLKSEILKKIEAGDDLLLDLTIAGAIAVKEAFPEDAVSVFVLPPSIDELRRRLHLRKRETEEQIESRIQTALEKEIPCADKFDYIIINDVLEEASKTLLGIVSAEASLYRRNVNIINELNLKGENV